MLEQFLSGWRRITRDERAEISHLPQDYIITYPCRLAHWRFITRREADC